MKTYLLKPGVRQIIAKAGETDIGVAFNAHAWKELYPAGRPQLMVTGPCGTRTPVGVDLEGDLVAGRVPDELLVGPGMYTYDFVWVSAGAQVQSGRCECMVADGELYRTWACHKPGPDWAERIFIAAEAIEKAIGGALEARNAAADSAQHAQDVANDLMTKSIDAYITPELFGAKRDGEHDDTLAIQQAIDTAAEKHLLCKLNAGTYLISRTLIIPAGSTIEGVSQYNTVIRLADGADCDVMRTVNYYELTESEGADEVEQPRDIILRLFSINGNRTEQTEGSGLLICASRSTISNVDVNNVKDHGLTLGFYQARIDYRSEGYAASQGLFVEDVRVMTCGKHCIWVYKGNDPTMMNVIAADASQDDTGVYDIISLTGGGRLFNVHPWSSNPVITDKICRYAVDFVTGQYECADCHFEGGGVASVHIASGAHVLMTSSNLYASRGTSIAYIESTMNQLIACNFGYHEENTKAVSFGASSNRNTFDVKMTTNSLDQIYFADDSESGGENAYRISWYGAYDYDSMPVVRNLQPTSSLQMLPNSAAGYTPMNYLRDLQLRKLSREFFIFNDNTATVTLKDFDTVVILSNANNKSISVEWQKHAPGTVFTFYNLSGASFQFYGNYHTAGSEGTTNGFSLPAGKMIRCMIVRNEADDKALIVKRTMDIT